MKLLKCSLLAAVAVFLIAGPALAQPNLVKLPGAPTDYAWPADWFKYPVMAKASAKGADWVTFKVYLQCGDNKCFWVKPGSNIVLSSDPKNYLIGFGKNPADKQSFANMVFGDPVPGEYAFEFVDVYWPRGTTKAWWLPTKEVVNGKPRGSWTDAKVAGHISWYTDAFYEHGKDVNYRFERLMDGTFVPAGRAKEAIPQGAVSARPLN